MAQAKKKDDEEEDERSPEVFARYRARLSLVKLAHDHLRKNEFNFAANGYNRYLKALEDYFQVEEGMLRPALFNEKDDAGELLLISQVYWNMSKIYDRSEKYESKCQECLEQFIRFSQGFKFQHLNSELIRKHLRNKKAKHEKLFEAAYTQIMVSAKKCYVATYCFGEDHATTETLRRFRDSIIETSAGAAIFNWYYRFSPGFVEYCDRHPRAGKLLRDFCFRPSLTVFSKLVRKTIL